MALDMNIIWFIGIIAFIILEAATYQLLSVWFAFGAVGGLIAALCGAGFYVQMAVFIVVSIIFLAVLRPLSIKFVKNKNAKTNIDSLIGKPILITEDVNNILGTGKGKINGMIWTVRSEDNSEILKDTLPKVVKVEGVKLIVKL